MNEYNEMHKINTISALLFIIHIIKMSSYKDRSAVKLLLDERYGIQENV